MIYNKYAERERLVPKGFPWRKWNGDRRLKGSSDDGWGRHPKYKNTYGYVSMFIFVLLYYSLRLRKYGGIDG